MKFFSLRSCCLMMVFGFILSGCSSDVSLVKNGTMNGFEKITIGKAFEASFDDPKWETFEGKKGERVVQFTGTISKDLHDAAMRGLTAREVLSIGVPPILLLASSKDKYELDWKVGDPAKVQWLINADGKTFQLGHMGSPSWKEGVPSQGILMIIYRS